MPRTRKISPAALLTLAVLSSLAHAQTPTTAPATPPTADVPVTRVVLYSSGVGYFEHNGSVSNNVAAELRFETTQINDVLKSLVVYDRGGGAVRTITYPANDPVNRTLRSFQVNLSNDPSLAEILKQIRGASVAIAVGDDKISGTVLGVEEKERPAGNGPNEKVVKTFVVNLVTDTGIRSLPLDTIRNLEIKDEKIKKEMNQALAALVQARDQSKKTVTVHFDGNGARSVGMGYLVETPIWKPTYRLMLPDASSKSPAELQAWAIVENQTDNDWANVTLSLVGGRPISFIQMLYQPLYVSRPVVQSTIIAGIVPQTYDNGITLPAQLGVQRQASNMSVGNLNNTAFFANGGQFANGLNQRLNQQDANSFAAQSTAADIAQQVQTDFTQGVAAIAEATKIGEMFHYTVDKVSLPRQQSSMIPIIAEGVQTDRLSVYSAAISSRFALRGLRLHNRTGKYLLAGPVTVMDTTKDGHSYAGDARIEDVPAGQSRLLTYAIDQDLLVQVPKEGGEESLLTATVVKGVLWLQYRSDYRKEYLIQNKSDKPKTLIIEHPLVEGSDLKEPAKATEKTDKAYRFEVTVEPGKPLTFPVTLQRVRKENLAILDIKSDPLALYLREGAIPASVKAVLTTVSAKRFAIADLERKKAQREQDRAQTLQEQANNSENVKVLPAGSKSQEAAINKMAAREADLEAANKDLKELQQSLESARNDLANYLQTTTVE